MYFIIEQKKKNTSFFPFCIIFNCLQFFICILFIFSKSFLLIWIIKFYLHFAQLSTQRFINLIFQVSIFKQFELFLKLLLLLIPFFSLTTLLLLQLLRLFFLFSTTFSNTPLNLKLKTKKYKFRKKSFYYFSFFSF